MAGDAGVDGLTAMTGKLSRIGPNLLVEGGIALYEEMQIERREMVKRTPVEFGPLRASIEVEEPQIRGREVSVRVQAGGPSAPYAIYVHEDLEAIHPVGEAKFIESVLLESAPYMGARVGRRVDLNRAAR